MIQLIYTESNSSGLVARLFLAAVMLPHGLQKALGWFGGKGLMPTLEAFDGSGIPYAVGVLVIAIESIGAVALLLGMFGRIMSGGILVTMIGAILHKHAVHGFFMNWSGMQEGEGFEFHLLAIGLALIVLLKGSGTLSFDRWLTRRHWA